MNVQMIDDHNFVREIISQNQRATSKGEGEDSVSINRPKNLRTVQKYHVAIFYSKGVPAYHMYHNNN